MNREVTVFYPRPSSTKHPITNRQSRQGVMCATFGLHCKSGEVLILRIILGIWELGLRVEGRSLVY
jgi:hypothetical protein